MWDLLVALSIGVLVFAAGLWAVRMLATPIPPEPDPGQIQEISAAYKCTICGMRLTVTHAQAEEAAAPRHCREPMVEA